MTSMLKNRIPYLQWLKTIAIIMVLVCHCCQMVPRVDALLALTSIIGLAGVPLFFMVNGALLLNKPLDIRKHVKKAIRFFMLCNIWAVIEGVINYFEYRPSIDFSITWVFRYFAGDTDIPNTGHFWYLRALVSVYIIFPALKELFDRHYKYFCLLMLLLFVVSFTIHSTNTIIQMAGGDVVCDLSNWSPFTDKGASSICFFGLGGIFHKELYQSKKKINIIIVIIILMAGIAGVEISKIYESGINSGLMVLSYAYQRVSTLLLSVSVFILLLSFSREKGNIPYIINYIGNNTLGIYFVHMIWLLPARILLKYLILDKGSFMWMCVETFVVLLLSVLSIEVIKKIPLLKKLV